MVILFMLVIYIAAQTWWNGKAIDHVHDHLMELEKEKKNREQDTDTHN